MQMLIFLREKIGWDKEEKYGEPIFTVPFVLTAAAALECTLNDYIINHFTGSEENNDSELVSGYLSMNLRGKLTNIVSLITDGEYKINVNHKTYQALAELIGVRNRLVHNKSNYKECDAIVVENENGDVLIEVDEEITKKLEDYTFGISSPIGRFQDALEDLYEKFFYIYRKEEFSGNELVFKVENA